MNVTLFSFPTMQQNHQDWQRECARWLADCEQWQTEYHTALETLDQISRSLQAHGRTLEDHASSTLAHNEVIFSHGKEMQDYDPQSEYESCRELSASSHCTLAEQHINQRQTHERIEKHHQQMILQVGAMVQAIEEAL